MSTAAVVVACLGLCALLAGGRAAAQDREPALEARPEAQRPGWLNPLVQQPLPATEPLRWSDGTPWDFGAQPLTLMRWWTDGCPFCRDSLPALADLARRFDARGLRLLPIHHPKGPPPGDTDLAALLARAGARGPFARDEDWTLLKQLMRRGGLDRATSISVLVDRRGRIRWVHPGPRLHGGTEHPDAAAAFAELEQLVDRLLPRAGSTSAPLVVTSCNVRYGTADDGADAWPKRKDLLLRTIAEPEPDLLCTQETLPFQREAIAVALPGHDHVGWSRTANEGDEQCAIFWRRSRFDRVADGHFMLAATPDVHGARGFDAALPRIVSWVRLRAKDDGRELLVADTHFDHRGVDARRRSWDVLAERLARCAEGAPIVLAGDFNTDLGANAPLDAAPRERCAATLGLVDAWLAAPAATRTGGGEAGAAIGTFHGFRGVPGAARIDGIFAAGDFQVVEAAIDRRHDGDRYPSDHFPIRCRLTW